MANGKQALHQQHAGEPRSAHTERQANRDFTPPRNRARKKKRGYIAAGEQENERQRPQDQHHHQRYRRVMNGRVFDLRSVDDDQRGFAIESKNFPLHVGPDPAGS